MDQNKLSQIELFAFDSPPFLLSGTGQSERCWHVVLKLSCGKQCGFAECILSADDTAVDLIRWGSFLMNIRNRTLEEALEIVRHKVSEWAKNQFELVQTALLKLAQVKYVQHRIAVGAELWEYRNHSILLKALPKALIPKQPHFDLNTTNLIDKSTAYFSIL